MNEFKVWINEKEYECDYEVSKSTFLTLYYGSSIVDGKYQRFSIMVDRHGTIITDHPRDAEFIDIIYTGIKKVKETTRTG